MSAKTTDINTFLLAAVHEFLFRKDKNLANVFKSKCGSVRIILYTWFCLTCEHALYALFRSMANSELICCFFL